MDRTGVSGVLQPPAVFLTRVDGHMNIHRQLADPADRGRNHLLADADGYAGQVDPLVAGDDAHDGEDAGAQAGGDEVGGGEGFALAAVVHRSISVEFRARRAVDGLTTQIVLIGYCDLNHERDCNKGASQVPEWTTLAWCAGIGVATGVISALCGVGGGIIMVPAFVLILGMQQKSAVGTSLAVIILTAAAASSKYIGFGFVDWKVAIPTGIASALVAWLAADWLKHFSNPTLTRMFAILVIVMGFHMLWHSRKPASGASNAVPTQHADDHRNG